MKIGGLESYTEVLEKRFSIKSTSRNRGFGLNNLLELTESSNGTPQIISNDGLVIKKAGRMYTAGNLDYQFRGTFVKVEVELNTFEELDERGYPSGERNKVYKEIFEQAENFKK